MRVLLVEDDIPLGNFLHAGLTAEHYEVDVATDGEQGGQMATSNHYDLVLLDMHLPKMDGLQVLNWIRTSNRNPPVLVVSARNKLDHRIEALNAGADDYLTKPFSFAELLARARALRRRGPHTFETVLRVCDVELDRIKREVYRGGTRVDLTSKEFALLEYLMRNVGRQVTRTALIEHVWNLSFDTHTNIVDVYINYLRRKIDDGHAPKLIHTVRGVGYRMAGLAGGEA